MTAMQKWTIALTAAAWIVVPVGDPDVWWGGAPFTRPGVFVFLLLGHLLFLVLPLRATAWPGWAAFAGAAAVLVGAKAAAGLLSAPHGLVGTYECLAGRDLAGAVRSGPPADARAVPGFLDAAFDPARLPAAGFRARPWRRVDPHLQLVDNGFSLGHDNFHLSFYNLVPWGVFGKPKLGDEDAIAPGSSHFYLDYCPLRVQWRGLVDLPAAGRYRFEPRSDGWWTVARADTGALLAAGGPGLPAMASDEDLPAGPLPVVIRYLRPPYPADTPRHRLHTRFELAWTTPDGRTGEVPASRLFPLDDPAEPDRTADAAARWLAWGGFAGMLAFLAAWAAWAVDWPAVRRRFFTDRMIVFLIAVGLFGYGVVEVVRHAARDSNWNTLDQHDYKTYLARGLHLYHIGGGTPESVRDVATGVGNWNLLGIGGAPPPVSVPVRTPVPPAQATFSPVGPVDAWLRFLATALDGRLGPDRLHPDEPLTADNALDGFYRNPAMDHYVAAMTWLTGERLGMIYLFQVFGACWGLWLTFLIARSAFGRPAALLAVAALAVDLHYIRFARFLFAEQLAGLVTPAAILMVVWCRSGRWPLRFVLTGAMLAVCVLVRPNLAFLAPVAGIWLLWARPAGVGLVRRFADCTAMGLAFLMVWSLQPVRNFQLSGRAEWSVGCGPVLLIIGSDLPADRDLTPYHDKVPGMPPELTAVLLERVRAGCFDYTDNPRANGDPLPYDAVVHVNPVLLQIYRDFALENPGHVVRMWFVKLWGLWGAGRGKPWPLMYAAIAIAALALLPWRRRGPVPWLLWGSILVINLPLILFYFEDRHRVPFLPLLHVFTGALLWRAWRLIRAVRHRPQAAA
jgi:hypothetical protein